MKKKVRIKKERHFKPHAEFYHASYVHLSHVQEKHKGSYDSLLSSLMMSAFSFEAYMNYLGPKVEAGWADFENSTTIGKFRHIALRLGYEIDFSKRPAQSLRELFFFRNKMAHPRDEKIVEDYVVDISDYEGNLYSMSAPKWLSIATEAKSKQCHDDIGKIMEELNNLLPDPEMGPTLIDGGSGGASVINE